MSSPILYDTHMHTPLCKHARGDPEEYAAVAEQRGLKGLVFTCHNPDPNGWAPKVRMEVSEFDDYVALVERARQEWKGRVDVLLGLESDYVPGMESWLEKLHSMAPLNYVLGSVHCHFAQYRELYFNGDVRAFQRTYFDHLALAAETGLFDCLSHPDLVKNVYPEEWQPDEILEDICKALDRISATGTAMELNTSGLNKRIPEMNPAAFMLREMQTRNIPVVIGSDSHDSYRVAADFRMALKRLKDAGYSHAHFFINREMQRVLISDAAASLR